MNDREEGQARVNWIELAYAADGRYKPDHPYHGLYTGLAGWQGDGYIEPPTEPYEDRWTFTIATPTMTDSPSVLPAEAWEGTPAVYTEADLEPLLTGQAMLDKIEAEMPNASDETKAVATGHALINEDGQIRANVPAFLTDYQIAMRDSVTHN